MKRWIIRILSILLIVLVIMYLFAYVSEKQWRSDSSVNIETAYFSDLYLEARKELGIFSNLFTLSRISIIWFNQAGITDIDSIGFSFILKASPFDVYDSISVSYHTDAVIIGYMRDEAKGFGTSADYYYTNIDADSASEKRMLEFINSISISAKEWFLSITNTQGLNDGIYRIYISDNNFDAVSVAQTDYDGFVLR